MAFNPKMAWLASGLLAAGIGAGVAQQVEPAAVDPFTNTAIVVDAQPGGQQVQPAAPAKAARVATRTPAVHRSRYRGLLRQFLAPDDQKSFGDFYDYGYWSGGEYAGQTGLPAGYWVYLAPNWYIFQSDISAGPDGKAPRPWGPEQATGAPDTWPQSGDLGTAWASKTPDDQPEWLELTYDAPHRPTAVLIYETFNPGAVNRVTGFDAKGQEIELWSGQDPTATGKPKGISVVPVSPDFDVSRVRVYLDSPKVSGWNEIDAVGLLDEGGVTHWAVSATASSTYADIGETLIQTYGESLSATPLPSLRLR